MKSQRRRTSGVTCGLILFAAIALASPDAAAQESVLAPGALIRIQGADEKQFHEGTFRALTPDSPIYSPGLATSTRSMPRSMIGKIEVRRYNLRARSVLRGAAIGSAVGLGGTLAITGGCLAFHSDCGLGLVVVTPLLIGGGFLVGALIGSQDRTQHWDQVYPPERSASLLIGPMPRGGIAIGLHVPFGEAGSR
jgi:hypothetical protein